MNLVTHSDVNIEAKVEEVVEKKEGDAEPNRAWKEHNEDYRAMSKKTDTASVDCRLMHHKVDQISTHLGITLYHPKMEQQVDGGLNCCAGGQGQDNACIMPP